MRRCEFTVRFDPVQSLAHPPEGALWADAHLVLAGHDLHPPPRILAVDNGILVLLGHPIAADRLDDGAVLALWRSRTTVEEFARRLNGTFTILHYRSDAPALTVISDRFGSQPFFYHRDFRGLLLASTSLTGVMLALEQPDLNREACFEFLHFRRLFGEKTLGVGCRFLEGARLLRLGPAEAGGRCDLSIGSYLTIDFTKTSLTAGEFAGGLADALRRAMRRYTSDGRNGALMLSGGLNARTLLAAAPQPLECLTTCASPNNEFRVAAELATARGAPHRFLSRPADHLEGLVDDAVFHSGGMTLFSQAQFGWCAEHLADRAEVVFMGLALEVFFGGLYLPKEPVRLLGWEGCHFWLDPIQEDVVGQFMAHVGYRTKGPDYRQVVRPERLEELTQGLRAAVAAEMAPARELAREPHDLWEYMHLRNFARHYSLQMVRTLEGTVACRLPALDNEVYAQALAIPVLFKYDWRAYQLALGRLNRKLARIRNANHNIRADLPLYQATGIRWLRGLANRLPISPFRTMPGGADRSWPSHAEIIRFNPEVAATVASLKKTPRLEELGFLDLDAVRRVVDAHQSGVTDYGILLSVLVTLERFLALLGH
ncbi:MAG: hypothetical protein HQL82_10385 [Magnetococcales bacterium]|nr:hypothetical protein [Magnetococcales bacterium]